MTSQPQPPVRLLTRANECRCENCPPDRVCAWACVQGTNTADIVIGAVLEQSLDWALEPTTAEPETTRQALWDTFNA